MIASAPGPDIGIVHATGGDFDQDIIGPRCRHLEVGTVDQLIRATVAGDDHSTHAVRATIRTEVAWRVVERSRLVKNFISLCQALTPGNGR